MLVLRFYVEYFKLFQTPPSLPNQEKQTEEDLPGHTYTESRQRPGLAEQNAVTTVISLSSSCPPTQGVLGGQC